MEEAHRQGRIPDEAKAVRKEILEAFEQYIFETHVQKQLRLEKEFDDLEMGTRTHAQFRLEWNKKIYKLEQAKIDLPSPSKLFLPSGSRRLRR